MFVSSILKQTSKPNGLEGNGYKAGGFDEDNGMGRQVETLNGVTDDLADFEDESVETVELGAKINLADGRGRLSTPRSSR